MEDLKVFKDISKDLATIINQLKEWKSEQQGVADAAQKTVKAMKGGGKLGKGSVGMMDTALAGFSGMSSSQFVGVRNLLANSMPTTSANFATAAIGNAPKVLGGLGRMMPDVGATFAQANNAYAAVVASGGRMSRGAFEAYAQNSIGRSNATGIGSQVEAGAYLAGRGMVMGSATFTQTMVAAGGLSMMMGMSNQAGAAAVEGLTSGAGSSNLLRNFGIYTSNPATGKAMGTQEILSQIKGRLTAGRGKYTTADVQESLRRGALGVTLQNSGLSADQQAMVTQSLMGDATDSKTGPINFNDPKSMERATKAMGGNPNAPFMKIYGAKNAAMSRAESAYGTGADVAAAGLDALNSVAGELANTFGALNSAAQIFGGDNAGSGAMNVLGGAGNLLMMNQLMKAGGLGGGLKGGLGGILSGKVGSMLGKGMGVLGGVTGAIGVGTNTINAYNKGSSGQEMNPMDFIGSGLSGVLSGAAIGSMFAPGIGTGIGAAIGGAIGLIAPAIGNGMGTADMTGGGGEESQPPSTGTTAAGGNTQRGVGNNGRLSLVPPVNGPLGDRFGAMASYRNHPHRGQDWSVGEGTQVRACASGKIVSTKISGELGRMVEVQHDGGWVTQYCHLSNNNIKTVGDTVNQGEYIANSGNTGTATTGAHLHLALMKGGQYYDPMAYMSGASGAPATTNDQTTDGSAGGSAGGDAGVTGDQSMPIASPGSNAVTAGTSGISGTATGIAGQLGASTGGGGEGLDKNPLLRKSSEDAYEVMSGRGKSSNTVTINLSIAQATDSEALKFAKRVKQILEDEKRIDSIGRN